jgi:plasmid stability protein
MTGPDHYREAERMARHAKSIEDQAAALVAAQLATAHATLALAAATGMAAPVDGVADSGMPRADVDEWCRAAGVKPPKGGAA